jgi:hypothetical protein
MLDPKTAKMQSDASKTQNDKFGEGLPLQMNFYFHGFPPTERKSNTTNLPQIQAVHHISAEQ